MFTKQHMELIAETLYQSKPESEFLGTDAHIRWNVVCENLAGMLANSNPGFNRNLFLNACGYND